MILLLFIKKLFGEYSLDIVSLVAVSIVPALVLAHGVTLVVVGGLVVVVTGLLRAKHQLPEIHRSLDKRRRRFRARTELSVLCKSA